MTLGSTSHLLFDGLVIVRRHQAFNRGQVDDQVVSLIDLTPTTLWCAGLARPLGMHGTDFPRSIRSGQERRYAFSARDRIDETVNRVRSVRGTRYHYIRNYFPDRHFASLKQI